MAINFFCMQIYASIRYANIRPFSNLRLPWGGCVAFGPLSLMF